MLKKNSPGAFYCSSYGEAVASWEQKAPSKAGVLTWLETEQPSRQVAYYCGQARLKWHKEKGGVTILFVSPQSPERPPYLVGVRIE